MENYTEFSLISIMGNNGYKLFNKKTYFEFSDFMFMTDYYCIVQVRTLRNKIHMVGSYNMNTKENLLIEVNLLNEIISIND